MTISVKLYKAEVRIYIVWKVLKIVLQENHHSRNRAKRYRALGCITYHVTNCSRKCHRLQFYRHKRYGASCLGFLSQISKNLFLNPNMVQIYIRYVSTEDFHIGRLLWSWLYVCRYKKSLWISLIMLYARYWCCTCPDKWHVLRFFPST